MDINENHQHLGILIETLSGESDLYDADTTCLLDAFRTIYSAMEHARDNQLEIFSKVKNARAEAMSSLRILDSLSQRRIRKHKGCAICLLDFENDDFGTEFVRIPCHHIFHKDCLVPWLRRNGNINLNPATCPTCRFQISSEFEKRNDAIPVKLKTRLIDYDTDVESP